MTKEFKITVLDEEDKTDHYHNYSVVVGESELEKHLPKSWADLIILEAMSTQISLKIEVRNDLTKFVVEYVK